MSVNPSRAKSLPDVATSVVLRNLSDGAETSTSTEASVALGELDTAFWHDGNDVPGGVYEVSINVSAVDVTSGDEAYTFELLVDDAAAMNDTPQAVGSLVFAAGKCRPGSYRMFIAAGAIKVHDDDSSGSEKYLAIKATLGGTSPSVTYGATLDLCPGAA